MKIRMWEAMVGKVRLVLLDTDTDENLPEDRTVTHYLYGGDNENRLRQELILGIGGIRALEAMGIQPDIYHSNEGHSAFISFERLQDSYKIHHLTFNQALEAVRSSTLLQLILLFLQGMMHLKRTFFENIFLIITSGYITWDELMALGRCEGDHRQKIQYELSGYTDVTGSKWCK